MHLSLIVFIVVNNGSTKNFRGKKQVDKIGCSKGDGGGPLVCPMNKYQNRTVQIGITAGGIGCGKPGIPGLYASVSDGICFIKHAIECYVSE